MSPFVPHVGNTSIALAALVQFSHSPNRYQKSLCIRKQIQKHIPSLVLSIVRTDTIKVGYHTELLRRLLSFLERPAASSSFRQEARFHFPNCRIPPPAPGTRFTYFGVRALSPPKNKIIQQRVHLNLELRSLMCSNKRVNHTKPELQLAACDT